MLLFIFSYFTGNLNCPVRAFIKYFSRLNPERTDFWQRPRPAGKVEDSDEVWYENSPVGKNSLGNLIAKISEKCDLSKRSTNHCIRSTCITILDEGGIETRHIIGLSGHKSENSVKSYCTRL
jgi:site-specific recombinase XerD